MDKRAERAARFAAEHRRELNLLIQANYAELEKRVLLAAGAGEDLYKAAAGFVLGIAPKDVTPEQRKLGKTLAYGIAYSVRRGEHGSVKALAELVEQGYHK
jgi:hypothetical protein